MSNRQRDHGVRGRLLRRVRRCEKCGRPPPLEVAHKKGLWTGGTDTDDNVIALCELCHFFQPDDGNETALKEYLADSLTVIQRIALNTAREAVRQVAAGEKPDELLKWIEFSYKIFNEMDGDMYLVQEFMRVYEAMNSKGRESAT